jgi:hypothetical protein
MNDFGLPKALGADPAFLGRQRRRQIAGQHERVKIRRSSFALTRPQLGFELGAGKEEGQIGEARPVGEGRKFAGQLRNIGRGALRTLDNFRDFNGFCGLFISRNMAYSAR